MIVKDGDVTNGSTTKPIAKPTGWIVNTVPPHYEVKCPTCDFAQYVQLGDFKCVQCERLATLPKPVASRILQFSSHKGSNN